LSDERIFIRLSRAEI